jgi:hypothetical protein
VGIAAMSIVNQTSFERLAGNAPGEDQSPRLLESAR